MRRSRNLLWLAIMLALYIMRRYGSSTNGILCQRLGQMSLGATYVGLWCEFVTAVWLLSLDIDPFLYAT